jgi:outer membrane protein assembly factor BamA
MPIRSSLPILCIFIWLFILAQPLYAQDTLAKLDLSASIIDSLAEGKKYLVLQEVILEGNHKTKPQIIWRELDVKSGDTLLLQDVDTILVRNKNKIFNTNLFVSVELVLEYLAPQKALLRVKMEERWYVFPFPIFELSDRNFNEWWNNYNADLRRTNYGLRFVWENFRGRKEKLELLTQFGFVRKFALNYDIPYLDRRQKHGLNFSANYVQNKSIAYVTDNHKLIFIDSKTQLMREKVEFSLGLTKRNAYYSFHLLELRFRNTWVADTIVQLNPNYFLGAKRTQKYFTARYNFRRDLRDVFAYPLKGSLFEFSLEKNGLGLFKDLEDLNTARVEVGYAKYQALSKKFYIENYFRGAWLVQSKVPYANAQALGYSESGLRGYENYVIDGQSFGVNKNTLKFELFNVKKKLNFIPLKQFKTVPMAMYLTAFWDMGYVQDRYFTEFSRDFSNRFIYGYGVGLDFFTYYNMVIRLNAAANRNGNVGFFLNFSSDL